MRIARQRRDRLFALVVVLVVVAAAAGLAAFVWPWVVSTTEASGRLEVQSDPTGAEIIIDGREAGHTPAELKLSAGVHHVEVGIGGSSKSNWVQVAEDRVATHRVELPDAMARGGLRITTNPPRGRVSVNGEEKGVAPLRVTNLKPGRYTVSAQGSFGPQQVEAVVKPGELMPLVVNTAGWLRVKAPFEVLVTEAGRVFGSTKGGDVLVPAGRHHFDLVNSTLAVKSRYFFDVPAGAVIPVYLDTLHGMMNLSSDEPADVTMDGKPLGKTPVVGLAAPLGQHEIVFRHARLGDVRYTVMVTLAAPVRIGVTFNKK